MRIATILFGVMAFAAPLKAAVIEYQFSGVIDMVYEPANEFGGQVHVDDPFVARFTFDTASPDLLPNDPQKGEYAATSGSLTVSQFNLTQGGALHVTDAGLDDLYLISYTDLFAFQIDFVGPGSSFTGDVLPSQLPDPAHYHLSTYFVRGYAKFFGHATSAVVVPEPTAVCLLSLGLLLMRRFR